MRLGQAVLEDPNISLVKIPNHLMEQYTAMIAAKKMKCTVEFLIPTHKLGKISEGKILSHYWGGAKRMVEHREKVRNTLYRVAPHYKEMHYAMFRRDHQSRVLRA